ncbi:PREDICTED: sugar phosphate exchanger 2 [Lipotes vexillifer]|uniref:Glucose-6-phosphate exchanger SLC37A2 n=1 Tax=Lipotes vexillifer TaxID=118797 RepID=A0A340XU73_LIPVE|nr:PREDICTED: sugar phosphate exchanger 2 [Lipotes vexillifer]
MRSSLAPGVWFLRAFSRDSWYRGFILLITFLIYTCYHMSRKPISVVKSRLHHNCSGMIQPISDTHRLNDTTWCNWAPFDQSNYKELLGAVDNAFLVAYAIGMFISGIFGERLPLRYYLTAGMLLSGLFTSLFGLGYFWNIHALWYFVLIQICNGLVQTTGWPSVVTCVGNWFGKGKRGLIMGIWNSHTSVGNILGSLVAGVWVDEQWGLSFVAPGIITAVMGLVTFCFFIEYPEDVDCSPPQYHGELEENVDNAEDPGNGPHSNRENGLESAVTLSKEPSAQPAAISFFGALWIPGVVEFSLCLLFAKLVSYTFLYWLPLYIFNVVHFSAKESGDLSTLFDVGGIAGGILAGLISDYTNGRATTCFVMLILAAPMMFLYNYVGQSGISISIVMLLICGALVNGPYALITTAVSADLGTHKSLKGNAKALSTVTAIIDGTGSIGAALGPLLAGLISPTGWNNVFYMLITADILACLLLCRLVYKEILGWRSSLSRDRGSSVALTHARSKDSESGRSVVLGKCFLRGRSCCEDGRGKASGPNTSQRSPRGFHGLGDSPPEGDHQA